ncbi:MAG: hypothetical protein M5U34_30210 [Chloroflexi bacterium]|nr:hypothetical protein [Chloroflexota bacterium]
MMLSGPLAAHDTLPYQKQGGEIGGSGNDFSEEWLPVHVGTDTLVNAVLTIAGADADAVTLEVGTAPACWKRWLPSMGLNPSGPPSPCRLTAESISRPTAMGRPSRMRLEIIDIPPRPLVGQAHLWRVP